MAARKGIKAKIVAMMEAEPERWWTGRELEAEYIRLGGNRTKDRPGISPTTLWRFIADLPAEVKRPTGRRRFGYNLDAKLRLDPTKLEQQRTYAHLATRARIRGIWDGLLPSTP